MKAVECLRSEVLFLIQTIKDLEHHINIINARIRKVKRELELENGL